MSAHAKPRRIAMLLTATALSTAGTALAQTVPVVSNDAQTQVYAAANGTTVVNIATPNAAGVSHNRFDQYNVPKTGVVLNNGGVDQANRTSQLAGAVAGNANITGAQASVILNEVVKANPSTLAGYTEILGGKADLVVANPWGITCDGCGFINTARLTLTTGTPEFAAKGGLAGVRATDGLVTVTGNGLDASAADTLALVARSVKLDGQVNAKAADVVAGANRYDPVTGEVTVIAAAKPTVQYAIDASALGSVYAGRIRLLATDAGVGVRALGKMGASAGDLTLTVDGQIVIGGQASASGAVAVTSANGGITSDHARVSAGTDLALNAQRGALTLTGGRLYAARDLTATGTALTDTLGSIADVDVNRRDAGRTATITVAGDARLSDTIWSGQSAALTAGATAITGGGIAADDLKLRVASLTLDRASLVTKRIDAAATGALSLTNTAAIISQNTTALSAAQLTNAGRITGGGDAMTLTGGLTNSGLIEGYGPVTIATGGAALDNSGVIRGNRLAVTAGAFGNRGTIEMQSGTIAAASVDNAAGATIRSGGALDVTGTSAFTNRGSILASGNLTTRTGGVLLDSGTIATDAALTVRAGTLTVESNGTVRGVGGVDAGVTGDTKVAGVLIGDRALALTGGGALAVTDAGAVASRGAATVNLTGALTVAAQALLQADSATVRSAALTNAGTLTTAGALALDTRGGAFANSGATNAGGAATLTTGALTNDGVLSAVGALAIDTGAQALTNSGRLLGGADARLTASALSNSGTLYTAGATTATLAGQLLNTGLVQTAGGLTLTAASLDNRKDFYFATATGANGSIRVGTLSNAAAGTLAGGNDLNLSVTRTLDNAGLLTTDGNLSLAGGLTTFSDSGALQAGRAATIDASNATLAVGAQGRLLVGTLDLKSLGLTNAGTIQSAGAAAIATSDILNSGLLNSLGTLGVTAANVRNPGTIQAVGGLDGRVARLDNSGTVVAAATAGVTGKLTITDDLHNYGTLASNGALALTTQGTFANAGTLYAAEALTLAATGRLTLDGIIKNDSGLLKIDTADRIGTTSELKLFGDSIALTGLSFDNQGVVVAAGDLTVTSGQKITNAAKAQLIAGGRATLTAGDEIRNDGAFQSAGNADLTATYVTNRGLLIGGTSATGRLTVSADTLANLTGGDVQSAGVVTLALGQTLNNSGRIIAGRDLSVGQRAGGAAPLSIISGGSSVLQAGRLLEIKAANSALTIGTGALWYAGTDARVDAQSLRIDGTLYSAGDGAIQATQSLSNYGSLVIDGLATVGTAGALTNRGTLQGGALQLKSGGLDNSGGTIVAGTSANANSNIFASSYIDTTPKPDANGNATSGIRSAGNVTMTVNGALTNSALVTAAGNLTLNGSNLAIDNLGSGVIQAGRTLDITSPGASFIHQNGAVFGDTLKLTLASLDNYGRLGSFSGNAAITLTGDLNNKDSGTLYFGDGAANGLAVIRAANVTNDGILKAQQRLTAITGTFNNNSKILGAGTLDLRLTAPNAFNFTNNTFGSINLGGTLYVDYYQVTDPLDGSSTQANFKPFANAVNFGTILAGSTKFRATTYNSGSIAAIGALQIVGAEFTNAGSGSKVAGHLGGTSVGDTDDSINAAHIANDGTIGSIGNLALFADRIENNATGGIGAIGTVTFRGDIYGSTSVFQNAGSLFGGGLDVTAKNFTNQPGGIVETAGQARFKLSDTFLNQSSVTAGTNLAIEAPSILNQLPANAYAIVTDQPSYFNPLWNDNPNDPNGIHGRGDLYDQGRLRGFCDNDTSCKVLVERQNDPDNQTDQYDMDFTFTEHFANLNASLNARPTLVSNGNMALTGFTTLQNFAGVISASNTLSLTGGTGATASNQSINAYKTSWHSHWDDYEQGGGNYVFFRSYEQHVTSKVTNESIGASISAANITGNNFGLVNAGSTQNGAITKTYTPPTQSGQQVVTVAPAPVATDTATATGATASDNVAVTAGPGITVGRSGTVTSTSAGSANAVTPPAVDNVLRGSAAVGAAVAANLTAGIGGSLSGPPSISFGTTVVNLPTSPNGLFVTSSNPSSKYLVETNPLFLQGDATGTALLAKLLGLDPDGLLRRLGDAQYEDYLIKQQLVGEIGTNLIARGLSQGQQTEALIRSGAAQAQTLGLTYGKALTADQQASLKTDMIWMVATRVNGQDVLAPVVYLSAETRNAFDKGDATISANYANLALTSLVNNGGTIKVDVLVADVKNNIDNTGGRISGKVVVLTAGGDITNSTFAQYGGSATSGGTQIGATGSISATQALSLEAAGDIKNIGANLFSGGSAALVAGKSITIDTIVDKRASTTGSTDTASTTHIGSNVQAAGDLFAQAQNDITIGGSTVAAGGLAMLDAGRDLNVVSRADTSSTTTRETGGNLVQRTSTETTESSTKSVGSSLSAGDLYVKTGRDMNVQGSAITVARDASIDVGRDLTVAADTDTTTKTVKSNQVGLGVGDALFGNRDTTSTDETGKNVGSSITIGGTGIVTAKNDVTLIGSKVSGTDVQVVGENVRLLDGKDYTSHTESESLTTVLGVSGGGSVGGSVKAEGGAYAGGHSVGGSAGASGKVGAQAGDGKDPTTSVEKETKTSTNYSAKNTLDGKEQESDEEEGVAEAKIDKTRLSAADAASSEGGKMERSQTGDNSVGIAGSAELKGEVNGNAGLALVQNRTSSSSSYSSTSVGSELSASHNLTVVANNDLQIRGSKIAAGKDAVLAANNISVETGQNVERKSSDSMTTSVGILVNSKNDTTVSGDVKASVGTTGTTNYDKTRNPTSSGGGVGIGGNLGETGGSASVSASIDGSSRNDIDIARNSQTSSRSEKITNTGSDISAGGMLTMIAKDKLTVTGSSLSGKEGVGLKAKDMAFLAAQDTTSDSTSSRTTAVGYYAQAFGNAGAQAGAGADTKSKGAQTGASASTSGEAGVGEQVRNEMAFTSGSTSTAKTSSITSENGNIVRIADGKITDQGTQITAGGDLLQKAQTWDSKAATNSYSSSASAFVDQVRSGVYADAAASAGADASGQSGATKQEGSAAVSRTGGASAGIQVSAFHADDQAGKSGTTAVVSNITTGGKVVSVTEGKTSLEGTQFKTGGDLTLAAGSLDWTAARDTKSNNALANTASMKAQVGLDAEKTLSAYGEAGYKGSGATADETTAHAGGADVGGKLTIVSQGKTNLEGTTLASGGDTSIYSKDTLTYSAATDTKAGLGHEQSLAGSISFAGKRGENVAAQAGVGIESTDETTAHAGSVTSGGKLVIQSDKDASFAGTKLAGTGTTAVIAAGDLNLGTADSSKNNYSGSIGVGFSASRAGETDGTGEADPNAPAAGTPAPAGGTTAPTGGTGTGTGAGWVSAKPTQTSGTGGGSGSGAGNTSGGGNANGNASPPATPPTANTSSSLADSLRGRSQEDQQIGTSAKVEFSMEKSTTRDAASVSSTNGNVVLKSGGTMNLEGTNISAGQTAVLDAGKDLNFTTANSDKLTVDAGLNLLGNRGSPGGIGTRVTDSTARLSTDGEGAANANATGAANNANVTTTTAGAKEDTKLSGGVEASAGFGYSSTQQTGSIKANNIVTKSGGDTNFVGTNLDARNNVDITAGGDVAFKTAQSVSADASIGLTASGSTNPGPIGGKTAVPAPANGAGTPAPAANATATPAPSGANAAGGTGKGVTIGGARTSTALSGAAGQAAQAGAANAAASAPDHGTEGQAGVTDIGAGVGITNQYSTVNAGGKLTVNAGGKVSMDGTTGDVGSSAINAVGGVDRSTAVSGGAELGLTRAGGFLDVQRADLGTNGATVTGSAAQAPLAAALAATNPLAVNAANGITTTAPTGRADLTVAPAPSAPAAPGNLTIRPTSVPTPGGPLTSPVTTPNTTPVAPVTAAPDLSVRPGGGGIAPVPGVTPTFAPVPSLTVPGGGGAIPAAPAITGPTVGTPLTPSVAPGTPLAQPLTPVQPNVPAMTVATSVPALPAPNVPGLPVATVPQPVAPSAGLTPPPAPMVSVPVATPLAPVAAAPAPVVPAPALSGPSATPTSAPSLGQGPATVAIPTPTLVPGSASPLPTAATSVPVAMAPASGVPSAVSSPPTSSGPGTAPSVTVPAPIAGSPRPIGALPADPAATAAFTPAPGQAAAPTPAAPTGSVNSVPVAAPIAGPVAAAPIATTPPAASPVAANRAPAGTAAATATPPAGTGSAPAIPASLPRESAVTTSTVPATGGAPQPPLIAKADTPTYTVPAATTAEAAGRSLQMPAQADQAGTHPIPLPSQIGRWTVRDGVLSTQVDVAGLPTDGRPQLILPNGEVAPAWLVIDLRTGVVSGRIPHGTGTASEYLARVKVR